jgi:hypothetical protein
MHLINHIKYLVVSEKSRFYSYFSTFTIGGGVFYQIKTKLTLLRTISTIMQVIHVQFENMCFIDNMKTIYNNKK